MALNFTTTTDKVSIADNAALDITGALSIYAWVYLNAGSVYHALVSKATGNGATATPYDFITGNGATPIFTLTRDGSAKSSTATISAATWTHLAVTDLGDNSADGCKFYKNAETPDLNTACATGGTANAKPVLIGERDDALGGNCRIAWVGIHNVILTQEEIAEAMQRGFTMRGLVGCWALWGDPTEADLSGNAFNGTSGVATDTGYKNPSTTGSPSNQWTTPSNAYASDDSRAIEGTVGDKQDYGTFAFGVPAGATINGIEVSVEWQTTGGSGSPEATLEIQLSWNAGSNYTAAKSQMMVLGDPEAYQASGGASDTWGHTWVDTELSDSNFRVRLNYAAEDQAAQQIEVDHLRLKVFYTTIIPAVEGPPVIPIWYRVAHEDIAALKNEYYGYPGQNFMIAPKTYYSFIKSPRTTGVTGREGFNLNQLEPEGS